MSPQRFFNAHIVQGRGSRPPVIPGVYSPLAPVFLSLWNSMVICPPMMWLWCWLRRLPIGCYSDLNRASNSTGRDVVVDVERSLSGQEMAHHYEPRRAQMLVWMRENVGVCKLQFLSSWWPSTFFYDLSLQLLDSQSCWTLFLNDSTIPLLRHAV